MEFLIAGDSAAEGVVGTFAAFEHYSTLAPAELTITFLVGSLAQRRLFADANRLRELGRYFSFHCNHDVAREADRQDFLG